MTTFGEVPTGTRFFDLLTGDYYQKDSKDTAVCFTSWDEFEGARGKFGQDEQVEVDE